MSRTIDRPLELHDELPREGDFADEVLAGLRQNRKQLPCKFFYDERGSILFDRICELQEYYLTRTELAIMRRHAREMSAVLGSQCVLIEYGSGSSLKTRILLDHLIAPAAYVPIDISRAHLAKSARQLSAEYPDLDILPVCTDYTAHFSLPPRLDPAGRRVVYFPGSTIGNFEPQEARQFLRRIRHVCGTEGGLLIGVDLKKDPALLHAAYNDAAGVTAEFNLNLLARINRELDADLNLDHFAHYAFYNPRLGRIEMHLLSLRDQAARIAGQQIVFREGESIFTESSYKYTPDEFEQLAIDAGFRLQQFWLDDRRFFSVQYLEAM